MSTRDLAELACRILAVALLAFTVVEISLSLAAVVLPVLNNSWGSPGSMHLGWVLLSMFFLAILFALRLAPAWFLWTRSEWIARQMVPYAESRSRWPRLRAVDLQVAGFACIGLYFFCTGVSQLGRFIGLLVVLSQEGRTIGDVFATEEFIGIVVNFAIGMCLMVKSRKVVLFLNRLRRPSHKGIDPAESATQLPADQRLV